MFLVIVLFVDTQLHTCARMMTLAVCRQEEPWALYARAKIAGGKFEKVPSGTACEQCFRIGVEVLGFSDWEAFVSEHREDEALQGKVKKTRAALQSSDKKIDLPPSGVEHVYRASVEVYRQYDIANEAELRSLCSVPRVSKPLLK